MPPRDPTKVQLDFPILQADLIRTLRLVGQIGLLDFDPVVRPTFIVGSRGLSIEQEQPLYLPAEIFQEEVINPAVNAIFADTGQLPAGDYDIQAWMSVSQTVGLDNSIQLQHRNAANTATLTSWFMFASVATTNNFHANFGLRLAEDERFRVLSSVVQTSRIGATIAIKRRVTP